MGRTKRSGLRPGMWFRPDPLTDDAIRRCADQSGQTYSEIVRMAVAKAMGTYRELTFPGIPSHADLTRRTSRASGSTGRARK